MTARRRLTARTLEFTALVEQHIAAERKAGRRASKEAIAIAAGYDRNLFANLLKGRAPRLEAINDVLNVIGYEVRYVRRDLAA
jgi:hypothetical protein